MKMSIWSIQGRAERTGKRLRLDKLYNLQKKRARQLKSLILKMKALRLEKKARRFTARLYATAPTRG